jgi:hypothetical protein
MKMMRVIVLVVALTNLTGASCCRRCAGLGERCGETCASSSTQQQQEYLDKLNDWDKEELDVVERPEMYPGRKASGETGGWIVTWKSELRRVGMSVIWDPKKRKYEVVVPR